MTERSKETCCDAYLQRLYKTHREAVRLFEGTPENKSTKDFLDYRIYSINPPGRLLNFWTLRVSAYSRWALIRGWAPVSYTHLTLPTIYSV